MHEQMSGDTSGPRESAEFSPLKIQLSSKSTQLCQKMAEMDSNLAEHRKLVIGNVSVCLRVEDC